MDQGRDLKLVTVCAEWPRGYQSKRKATYFLNLLLRVLYGLLLRRVTRASGILLSLRYSGSHEFCFRDTAYRTALIATEEVLEERDHAVSEGTRRDVGGIGLATVGNVATSLARGYRKYFSSFLKQSSFAISLRLISHNIRNKNLIPSIRGIFSWRFCHIQ